MFLFYYNLMNILDNGDSSFTYIILESRKQDKFK